MNNTVVNGDNCCVENVFVAAVVVVGTVILVTDVLVCPNCCGCVGGANPITTPTDDRIKATVAIFIMLEYFTLIKILWYRELSLDYKKNRGNEA
jgi:hypothetical protein